MSTLICGSIAFDSIMVFHDRFRNHILPEQIHILNVSFLVPEMRREFGGCAGNIAYNLKLLGGEPCDVLILTEALIRQLTESGQVAAGSARALGVVKTGVAVKAGEPLPATDTPEALKAALLAARGIYFPDPVKATAGIHFMKVLQTLGLDVTLADRLRPYPNGNAAMGAMAQANEPGLIGCTQVTEILYTGGVSFAGLLPPRFELATTYTAAVASHAALPGPAKTLLDLLTADSSRALREAGGFES